MKDFANKTKAFAMKQPMSTLLVLLIWVICMIPIPETPLNDVAFIDKWTHLVMYGTLVIVIMTEYGLRRRTVRWGRFLLFGLLAPICMGGLIELAQAYLTNGVRSGDWIDFAANAMGAVIGCLIGIPLALFLSTRNRGVRP